MSPREVGSLISFIGTATQLGGALLLAAFFLLLRGHAARRPYFRAWSLAWVWMSLALLAVFSLYQFLAEQSARGVWFVYQASKLAFLSSLLAGALAYALPAPARGAARGPPGVGRLRRAHGAAVADLQRGGGAAGPRGRRGVRRVRLEPAAAPALARHPWQPRDGRSSPSPPRSGCSTR